jgi:predicted small integral membrane protein
VALGLGAKLTTALVLPVMAVLALLRGRRATLAGLAGALVGLAAIGMWGYVLNIVHTGHVLGHGGGRIENTTSPSWPGTGITSLFLVYEAMDRAVLSNTEVHVLAVIGVVGAAAAAAWAVARRRRRDAPWDAAGVLLPLVAALLVICAGWFLSWLSDRWGHQIRRPKGIVGPLNHGANEDTSAFGPLGSVLLVALPAIAVFEAVRRRAGVRVLALAASVPVFFVLLVLQSKWNEFLTRFLVVPVVLAAPLLAFLFRRRLTAVVWVAVAVFVGLLTVAHMESKPLSARPWNFTEVRALQQAQNPQVARAYAELEREVPPQACIGAVLGLDEPAYLLFGSHFQHHVAFLPVTNVVHTALVNGLFYVVISTGPDRTAAADFRAAGWHVTRLGSFWFLAAEPKATTGAC